MNTSHCPHTVKTAWVLVEFEDSDEIHVIPMHDDEEHTAEPSCWCRPTPDINHPNILVHNSADGREDYETGRRQPH